MLNCGRVLARSCFFNWRAIVLTSTLLLFYFVCYANNPLEDNSGRGWIQAGEMATRSETVVPSGWLGSYCPRPRQGRHIGQTRLRNAHGVNWIESHHSTCNIGAPKQKFFPKTMEARTVMMKLNWVVKRFHIFYDNDEVSSLLEKLQKERNFRESFLDDQAWNDQGRSTVQERERTWERQWTSESVWSSNSDPASWDDVEARDLVRYCRSSSILNHPKAHRSSCLRNGAPRMALSSRYSLPNGLKDEHFFLHQIKDYRLLSM